MTLGFIVRNELNGAIRAEMAPVRIKIYNSGLTSERTVAEKKTIPCLPSRFSSKMYSCAPTTASAYQTFNGVEPPALASGPMVVSGLRPSPTLSLPAISLKRLTNSSWISSAT